MLAEIVAFSAALLVDSASIAWYCRKRGLLAVSELIDILGQRGYAPHGDCVLYRFSLSRRAERNRVAQEPFSKIYRRPDHGSVTSFPFVGCRWRIVAVVDGETLFGPGSHAEPKGRSGDALSSQPNSREDRIFTAAHNLTASQPDKKMTQTVIFKWLMIAVWRSRQDGQLIDLTGN